MEYDLITGGSNYIDDGNVFYTIGDLISLLRKYPKRRVTFLGTDLTIGDLISWRGSYDVPAITYTDAIENSSTIADRLEDQLGYTHTGWKGGEFMFYPHNEFYIVPNHSSVEYHKVIGYEMRDDDIVLLTKIDEY